MLDENSQRLALDYISIVRSRHPLLADRLEMYMNEPEIEHLLDQLLVSPREYRVGFDFEVFSAISNMKNLYRFEISERIEKFRFK